MMIVRVPLALCGATLLALVLACGGGSGSSSGVGAGGSRSLAYQDPPAQGYRFVRNPSLSSSTHLVLELVGPAGATGRGVDFTLDAGTNPVVWAPVSPQDLHYAANVAFNLGLGPQIFLTKAEGGRLTAMMFQKGKGNAIPLNGTLCRVALDLAGAPPPMMAMPLKVTTFQVLPATGPDLVAVECALGTLSTD